ncbi:hypothetical protein [Variovorax ginsengisoli]|uniref:Serine/threonine protein phosphatase n=1 Tax=Variovorax ginsengisoli TaxID=363844 RepID=A0ABT9S7U2_9BURK|nr:hypothetical protein [Variovorax ginsengisoli]MDP9900415.1 hypothetical protein [Variovorax ginsengisoli]
MSSAKRSHPRGTAAAIASPEAQGATADRYADFLRTQLPQQADPIARHRLGDERVWLKKAGPRHGRLRYHLLAAIAGLLRLDVLKPVPNPGGDAAIAIEARRLRALGALGLRVPAVLAEQADGLLISDLGESGSGAVVLRERLDQAAADEPTALLAVWREGLEAIAVAHARGAYLSQAFDRNLMRCPDGVVGYIDFEDDPGETLSVAECQVRDWLSYLHSTAVLVRAASPQAAGALWHAALAHADLEVRERIGLAAQRMRWLRHLPASRRWGRDTQRVRAAALLLGRWHGKQGR